MPHGITWEKGYTFVLLRAAARGVLLALSAVLSACSSANHLDSSQGDSKGLPPAARAASSYGVVVTGGQNTSKTMEVLGASWYLDYSFDTTSIPQEGYKALKVRSHSLAPAQKLQAAARARPGSFWIIGNEANVPDQDDISPEEYAKAFYYYASIIRGADPTARLVAPETLNFDYTCVGCAGYPSGREWLEGFLAAYRSLYGTEPPIDIWSIHTYVLDWEHLPMIDASIAKSELETFRRYVDALPGQQGKPIWLTEFGIVWGYAGIEWRPGDDAALRAYPVGPFQEQAALGYLAEMLDWLEANRQRLGIERWFFFSSHGHTESWAGAPAGVTLVGEQEGRLRLTPYGELYRRYTLAQPAKPTPTPTGGLRD